VVVVTVDPQILSDGIVAQPLIEPSVPPSQLLADAREIAAATRTTEIRTEARQGNPADEILKIARAAHADLIVIGRTGKSFLAREILGSVALRVVKVARCDVLVVAWYSRASTERSAAEAAQVAEDGASAYARC
jgi:nucleotide-binding universal stress UspA family protein